MGEANRRRAASKADIVWVARDTTSPWNLPEGPAGVLVCEIGSRGGLGRDVCRQAVDWMSQAVDSKPEALIMVTVGGFEDDPREALDIPEARQAFQWFGERMREIDDASGTQTPRMLNRLESTTRGIIMVAMGLLSESKMHLTTDDDPVLTKQWLEDQDRLEQARQQLAAELAAKAGTEPKQ